MNRRISFEDALDAAIDAMRAGQTPSRAMGMYGRYAPALAPLLQTAAAIDAARPSLPAPARLPENYATVRNALRAARGGGSEAAGTRDRAGWMTRRVTFASLSLPVAGIAAVMLAGSGAAAATIAVTQPAIVQRAADVVTPSWVQDKLPGIAPDRGNEDIATPAPGPTNAAGIEGSPESSATTASGDVIDASGIISDSHGNSFTLTSADTTWTVVLAPGGSVSGSIEDGRQATVHGRVAGKTLHADTVSVASGEETPAADGTPQPDENAPGNSGNAPGHNKTPGTGGGTPTADDEAPGNSGDAPGHNKTSDAGEGTPTPTATADDGSPGNSGSAPGQNKTPDGGPPGQSGTPPGNSGSAPGHNKTPRGQQ